MSLHLNTVMSTFTLPPDGTLSSCLKIGSYLLPVVFMWRSVSAWVLHSSRVWNNLHLCSWLKIHWKRNKTRNITCVSVWTALPPTALNNEINKMKLVRYCSLNEELYGRFDDGFSGSKDDFSVFIEFHHNKKSINEGKIYCLIEKGRRAQLSVTCGLHGAGECTQSGRSPLCL